MRVIIAGSRTINDLGSVAHAIEDSGFDVTEVVSGGAKGIDRRGEEWASVQNIPIIRFLPNWKLHGNRAGPIRNREMAKYADALVAVWDGESRGTANMIKEIKALNKPHHVHVRRIRR